MSAPSSAGERSSVSASRSVATTTGTRRSRARAQNAAGSPRRPSVAGYWMSAPNAGWSSASPTTTRHPSASARAWTTAIVCGWQSEATKNTSGAEDGATRLQVAIASAAAVASSSRLALLTANPVRSCTIVWNTSRASRRPCAISAWYGVYAVYQHGFSRIFLRITPGVTVSWYPMPR